MAKKKVSFVGNFKVEIDENKTICILRGSRIDDGTMIFSFIHEWKLSLRSNAS